MENENIVMLRLYGGEMIMGKEVPRSDLSCSICDTYDLEDPRSVIMMPTMRGDLHVAMKPVCAPFMSERLKKNLSVPFAQVMFMLRQDEIDKELVNGYKSEITGIKIASVEDTMAINSSANSSNKGGEFIL